HDTIFADLISLAGVVATAACPGGPVIPFFVGRKDKTTPDLAANLPDVNADLTNLLGVFNRMGLTPTEMVALIGSHTAAKRFGSDAASLASGFVPGSPLDTTVEIWDTSYYTETLQHAVPAGTQRLPSDQKMATDPRTSKIFSGFQSQGKWNGAFSKAMVLLGSLGVNPHTLTECKLPSVVQKPLPSNIRGRRSEPDL
ncbi:heme peroxidase, partial [Blyttiomyces helicus]